MQSPNRQHLYGLVCIYIFDLSSKKGEYSIRTKYGLCFNIRCRDVVGDRDKYNSNIKIIELSLSRYSL